ncbi:MAG: hypothetical protein QNJ85_00200 [Gammaproteobacteria bacterium]|nr:hypothetical protein [Gammaproteobacteria bacterium]
MNNNDPASGYLLTSQLLSQLDMALDRSSIMRDIVAGYERLRMLESLTGPTRRTRLLRQEIARMESQLHL